MTSQMLLFIIILCLLWILGCGFLVRAVSALLTLQFFEFCSTKDKFRGEQKDNEVQKDHTRERQELLKKNRKDIEYPAENDGNYIVTSLHACMRCMYGIRWCGMAIGMLLLLCVQKVFPLKSKRSNETRVKANQSQKKKKKEKEME